MADKKEKEFKEYVVNVKSVGSQLSYKGKPVILNNGLSQSILKALYNAGMRSITKKVK